MSAKSENQESGARQRAERQIVDVARAIGAIFGVPLTLFAIISSLINQPFIALVVALVTAILVSIWVVYTRWTGFLEVAVAGLALIVVVLAGFVIWPRTMTVEGTILDTAGISVSHEKVVLIDVDGVHRETSTDSEGHYQFKRVPCGPYRVRVRGHEVGGGAAGILPIRVVYTNLAIPEPTPKPAPTHTSTNTPTLTYTPTATSTVALTYTPAPTPFPVITETPSATPTLVLQSAPCSPEVNITFPRMDEKLNGDGTVDIKGTASIPDFDFYKVEWGEGEVPSKFHIINPELHRTPIIKGILDTWNTGSLSEGVYTLRLTVVDNRGDFPPPCEVRIFVER